MNINKETLNTEKEIFRTEFADKTSTYMCENKTIKMQNDTKTKDSNDKLKDVEEAQISCNRKEEKTLKQYSFDQMKNTNIMEEIEDIKANEVETNGVNNDLMKNYEKTEMENENAESENSYAFKNCISEESIKAKEMLNNKHKLIIEENFQIECKLNEKIERKTLNPMEESSIFSLKCENDKNISLKNIEEKQITNEENVLEMDIKKTVIEGSNVSKTNDSASDIFQSYSDNLEHFNCDEDRKEIFSTEIIEFYDGKIEENTDKENKNDTFNENVKTCIDNDSTLDDGDADSLVMEELAKDEKEQKEEEEEEMQKTQDEYSNENKPAIVTKNNNEVDKMTSDKHVETVEDTKNDKNDEEETENLEKCASIDTETTRENNVANIKKDVTDFAGVELEIIKQENLHINRIEKLKSQNLCLLNKNAKEVTKIKENKKFLKKLSIVCKTKTPLCKIQNKKKTVTESEKTKNGIKKVIAKTANKKIFGSRDTKKCTKDEDINFKNKEQIKKKEKTDDKENKANDKDNTSPNMNQYNFSNIKIKKFDVFHNLTSIDKNENVVEEKKIEETEPEENEVKHNSKIPIIIPNENTEYENESPVEIATSNSNSSRYNEDTYQDKNKNMIFSIHHMKQNNIYNNFNKPAEHQKMSSYYNYKVNKIATHKKVNVFNKVAQKTDLNKKYNKSSFKDFKQVLNGSNLNYATYNQYQKNTECNRFTDYYKWNTSNIPKQKQVRTVGTQKCFTKKMVNKGVNTSNFVCATNDNKKIALPNFIYTPSLKLQNYNFDAIQVKNGRVVPEKTDFSKVIFQNS